MARAAAADTPAANELPQRDGDRGTPRVSAQDGATRGVVDVATTMTKPQATSRGGLAAEEAQQVDEAEVKQFGADDGVSARELIGTGFTYRHDWGDRNGQWKLNLNWGAVTANSRVFVAIAEGAPGGGKFIGAARYTLHNVAPTNGSVNIWINIEWSSPIRLYVDYLVVNP